MALWETFPADVDGDVDFEAETEEYFRMSKK
jgi:hypothetical protein